MNHRAESNSDIEEELAKISLPNGIVITISSCGTRKIEKEEIDDAFDDCYGNKSPKPAQSILSESLSSESPSSESPSSEPLSSEPSPTGTIRENIARAIYVLRGGCK